MKGFIETYSKVTKKEDSFEFVHSKDGKTINVR